MSELKHVYCKEAPLISLIIPVYNVEAYLRKCLDSVAAQTFKNFEVIVINDGSPDHSQQIIDEYTARYENFRGITIQNRGIGAVRTLGVREAKGQYIAFVDSDDWVTESFLEDFYDRAVETGADIVCCEYYYIFASGFKVRLYPGSNRVVDAKRATGRLINDFSLHHFVWNKMFRRSLFLENGVDFPPILFEDIATTARLFFHAERVAFLSKANYYYFQRQGSILHNATYRRLQEHINAFAMLRGFFDKMNVQKKFSRNLWYAKLSLGFNIVGEIISLNPEKRNQSMLRDIVNAMRQLRAFKNEYMPIKGEPWEELVSCQLYAGERVPGYTNEYRDADKPYCSFYEDYDSGSEKQYAEV